MNGSLLSFIFFICKRFLLLHLDLLEVNADCLSLIALSLTLRSDSKPLPISCTVPRPYLARVRAHIQVRAAGLDWTGELSVKQAVQYLDLLRREQLPSHLLPQEVAPAVAVAVGQR